MPRVLKKHGIDLFFYSNEGNEPPHIHVIAGGEGAKVWLEKPLRFAKTDLKSADRKKALNLIEDNRDLILEKWNEHKNRKR